MKYCNILLSALATVMTLTGIMPCGTCAADAVRAASLGHNKAIAHRVYEEGVNLSCARHSHWLMKQLGMLPTPATGSATGGSPADGTAR